MARIESERRHMHAGILLVERHDLVRKRLEEWLRLEFPHCSCIAPASREQACSIARAETPDIVLVDIDMQGPTASESLRMLKAAAPGAHLIALSAYEAEALRDFALKEGASGCVSKCLIDSELKNLIDLLLAGKT